MDLHIRYPGIDEVRTHARRRLPHFVWEYIDSGTGMDATVARNRAALDRVLFTPRVLGGPMTPDTSVRLLGENWSLPFGIAPVGMSGLIWPDAERLLARAATRARIPYTLSTLAAETPEFVGPSTAGRGWFQLYPPRDPELRTDLLNRARDAGFSTMVLTVDLPAASRRERQARSGLTQPPRLTPRILAQVAARPAWAAAFAVAGMPRMKTLDRYVGDQKSGAPNAHAGYQMRVCPDWDYVRAVRDAWKGPFHLKGILRPEDATRAESEGVDAIWVSNHGGRQFDAAPSPIEVLPAIRDATRLPLIMDSGLAGGLDILRALALGADFCMLGRAFHFGLAALGRDGPDHVIDILRQDLAANMGQIDARDLSDLAARLYDGS